MQNFSIAALLDKVREVQDLKSDYMLAKSLGFSQQKLSNWRHGRALPDEKATQSLATAAKMDAHVLIAQMNAERASDPEARAIWQSIAARLQSTLHTWVTAVLAVLFATLFVAHDAEAAPTEGMASFNKSPLIYLYIV